MKINLDRAQTTVLFVILFLVVGYVAPIVYVSVSPQEEFVEVHDFKASNTHVGADAHNICFNRTVNKATDVDITVELLLLRDNVTIEETSFEVDAYYQGGDEEVIFSRQLPENLESGTYKYIHNVELSYFNGQTEKNIKIESNEFTVYKDNSEVENSSDIITC